MFMDMSSQSSTSLSHIVACTILVFDVVFPNGSFETKAEIKSSSVGKYVMS